MHASVRGCPGHKAASSEPSEFSRAMRCGEALYAVKSPPTTILPSLCTATARMQPFAPGARIEAGLTLPSSSNGDPVEGNPAISVKLQRPGRVRPVEREIVNRVVGAAGRLKRGVHLSVGQQPAHPLARGARNGGEVAPRTIRPSACTTMARTSSLAPVAAGRKDQAPRPVQRATDTRHPSTAVNAPPSKSSVRLHRDDIHQTVGPAPVLKVPSSPPCCAEAQSPRRRPPARPRGFAGRIAEQHPRSPKPCSGFACCSPPASTVVVHARTLLMLEVIVNAVPPARLPRGR